MSCTGLRENLSSAVRDRLVGLVLEVRSCACTESENGSFTHPLQILQSEKTEGEAAYRALVALGDIVTSAFSSSAPLPADPIRDRPSPPRSSPVRSPPSSRRRLARCSQYFPPRSRNRESETSQKRSPRFCDLVSFADSFYTHFCSSTLRRRRRRIPKRSILDSLALWHIQVSQHRLLGEIRGVCSYSGVVSW